MLSGILSVCGVAMMIAGLALHADVTFGNGLLALILAALWSINEWLEKLFYK